MGVEILLRTALREESSSSEPASDLLSPIPRLAGQGWQGKCTTGAMIVARLMHPLVDYFTVDYDQSGSLLDQLGYSAQSSAQSWFSIPQVHGKVSVLLHDSGLGKISGGNLRPRPAGDVPSCALQIVGYVETWFESPIYYSTLLTC
jgi:hypothetical protein